MFCASLDCVSLERVDCNFVLLETSHYLLLPVINILTSPWLFTLCRKKKINDTKEDERTHKQNPNTSNHNHSLPASFKPDTGFGGRGVGKAFKDAGIGINTKLGVKKTAVSSGSVSRDVSDDGNSLLKRNPIIAEKCMSIFFWFSKIKVCTFKCSTSQQWLAIPALDTFSLAWSAKDQRVLVTVKVGSWFENSNQPWQKNIRCN